MKDDFFAHAWVLLRVLAVSAVLAGCGGGNGALDNASSINNPPRTGGQKLSFAYFQKCVNPVLNTPIPIVNSSMTSTCAAGGCHDNVTGTGGALRLVGGALPAGVQLTPDEVRALDIYKNYYSSLGVSVVGSPEQSLMLNKPLVRGVLHGGGTVFASADDLAAKTIKYWINRPMPPGQDEFSSAANSMFTPADPVTGACNVE
jgi:hypothetical protein